MDAVSDAAAKRSGEENGDRSTENRGGVNYKYKQVKLLATHQKKADV